MSELLLDLIIFTGEWVGATIIIFLILSHDDLCSNKRSKCHEAREDTNRVYHAYWVEEKGRKFEWHCSRCKTVWGLSCVNMSYCPHCGARMVEHPWATSECGQTLPTVDAVSVVQCKDCKYYMTIYCPCDGCCISPDWYCADGKRREADV